MLMMIGQSRGSDPRLSHSQASEVTSDFSLFPIPMPSSPSIHPSSSTSHLMPLPLPQIARRRDVGCWKVDRDGPADSTWRKRRGQELPPGSLTRRPEWDEERISRQQSLRRNHHNYHHLLLRRVLRCSCSHKDMSLTQFSHSPPAHLPVAVRDRAGQVFLVRDASPFVCCERPDSFRSHPLSHSTLALGFHIRPHRKEQEFCQRSFRCLTLPACQKGHQHRNKSTTNLNTILSIVR